MSELSESTDRRIVNFKASQKKSVLQMWPHTSGTKATERVRAGLSCSY